ncbi:MAG: DNRLRE domain-containing protein, partial [Ardenticatenaceae bacterium]
ARADIGSQVGWYEWDIRDLVVDWLDGRYRNYGLHIMGDERPEPLRKRLFWSREGESQYAPRLVIDYSLTPADNQAPIVTVNLLPKISRPTFTVSWRVSDLGGSGLDYIDVEYRVDNGDWIEWLNEQSSDTTSREFTGTDGHLYQFRARGVDNAGNAQPFGASEAQTRVDGAPPEAKINQLPAIQTHTSFTVSWSGDDGQHGSGIHCYDIQYRFNNTFWVPWKECVTATTGTFIASRDGLYEFEARAEDNLGHVESLTNQQEAVTIVDAESPFVEPRLWLPLVVASSDQ